MHYRNQIAVLLITLFPCLCQAFNGVRDYNYLMFENFVLNENIFRHEVPVIRHLKNYRSHLEEVKSCITDFLGKKTRSIDCDSCNNGTTTTIVKSEDEKFRLKDLIRLQSEGNRVGDSLITELHNLLENSYSVLIGAYRGLVMLQETYSLDILEMADGRVSYKGKVFQSNGNNKLDAEDLMNMASVAYEDKWYDSTIRFLKASKDVYEKTKHLISYDGEYLKQLKAMTTQIVPLHNAQLSKKRFRVGTDFKVFPYLVDEKLNKKKQQPKWIKKTDFYVRNMTDQNDFTSGDRKEDGFRRICRGELKGVFDGNFTQPSVPRCHLLHQNNPYLVLGPFKLEVMLIKPYRVVFHDFLSEAEIEWMIEYSKPRLSHSRGISPSNYEGARHEFRDGKRTRTVHKTVQVWFNDVEYNEVVRPDYENKYIHPLTDVYGYKVINPLMYKLSHKIERATRMNVTSRFASTHYQTTNYGLGGLCETHLDPHGYLDGIVVPNEKAGLWMSGDMLATFMAWLADVPAGGGTGYDYPTKEMLVEPSRGAAAFWMDLKSSGRRESASTHGGCPVLVGSKWILNKWIYSFDQWKTYPCLLDQTAYTPPFSGYYQSRYSN